MATLPRLKKPPAVKRGPRIYQATKEPDRYGPPGDAPEAFLTQQTTQTEWIIYWALARIFNNPTPDKVRHAPFEGGWPIWTYQAYVDAQADSQTNIDFVIWAPNGEAKPIAIRIQTEFFHNFANVSTQIYDITHRERLQNGFEVVDIYDYMFLRDESGQAAILLCKLAMGLIEPAQVITSGAVQRV